MRRNLNLTVLDRLPVPGWGRNAALARARALGIPTLARSQQVIVSHDTNQFKRFGKFLLVLVLGRPTVETVTVKI
eukprot:2986780-Rhodomonas_salina.1